MPVLPSYRNQSTDLKQNLGMNPNFPTLIQNGMGVYQAGGGGGVGVIKPQWSWKISENLLKGKRLF